MKACGQRSRRGERTFGRWVYALAVVMAMRFASVPELVNRSSSMLGKRFFSSCSQASWTHPTCTVHDPHPPPGSSLLPT